MPNTGTFTLTQFKVSIVGNPQSADPVYRDERDAITAASRLHTSAKAPVAIHDAGGMYVYLFADGQMFIWQAAESKVR